MKLSSPNRTDKSRVELLPGVWLDAGRAIWFEQSRTLAVADLHLGYAWAHRHGGQLMPVGMQDDCIERLAELVARYKALRLAVLGDIVHAAVPVPALAQELQQLHAIGAEGLALALLAGNHDRKLRGLLHSIGIDLPLQEHLRLEPDHLLLHGNEKIAFPGEAVARLFIGHEHPAISVSDRVATSAKCPCFLVSERVIVLPAFSRWAAGTSILNRRWSSPYTEGVHFRRAYAVMSGKLLPIDL